MNSALLRTRAFQIAMAAFIIACVVAAWTAARALRIEPTAAAAAPTFATADALAKPPVVVPVDVNTTVAMNLFSPERKAPARRYRLAGYAEPVASAPPPKPLVLGTAVATDNRSFAVCRMPDGPAVIVRVGDRIGTYTVRSIARNQVVFAASGEEPFAVTAGKQ